MGGIGQDKDKKNFEIELGASTQKWPEEWLGQNVQGKALMRVRSELIAQRELGRRTLALMYVRKCLAALSQFRLMAAKLRKPPELCFAYDQSHPGCRLFSLS